MSGRVCKSSLPYENASSGERALAETQRILARFNVQAFGTLQDFERKVIIVQFRYRDLQIHVEASVSGYAAAWLKAHPWSRRCSRSREAHEQHALRIARSAVYSVLRDWIKGQVTAVETGILSFEGAFLGQILLPSGMTVLQHMAESKLLAPGAATSGAP